jgi:hypothetical protein
MTAEDAPNASDEPLAVTKPPEDLAAQPTGNASRTRRARHRHSANPAWTPYMAVRAAEPPASTRSRAQLTITGAIRSP